MIRITVYLKVKRNYRRHFKPRPARTCLRPVLTRSKRGRIARWVMNNGRHVKENGRHFYVFDLAKLESALCMNRLKIYGHFRFLHEHNGFGFHLKPDGLSRLELPRGIPAGGLFSDRWIRHTVRK